MKGTMDSVTELLGTECGEQKKVAVVYAMPCGCSRAVVHPVPEIMLDHCAGDDSGYYAIVALLTEMGHTAEEVNAVSLVMSEMLTQRKLREASGK